jgi:hypothetical protein
MGTDLKKQEFEEGLPADSVIIMSNKSAYVTSEILPARTKYHFLPRKPSGQVLIVLDGHWSHVSDNEIVDFGNENYIVLLCLRGHSSYYLQPLDRSFFKSLKIITSIRLVTLG